jgi:hypothetical protein
MISNKPRAYIHPSGSWWLAGDNLHRDMIALVSDDGELEVESLHLL